MWGSSFVDWRQWEQLGEIYLLSCSLIDLDLQADDRSFPSKLIFDNDLARESMLWENRFSCFRWEVLERFFCWLKDKRRNSSKWYIGKMNILDLWTEEKRFDRDNLWSSRELSYGLIVIVLFFEQIHGHGRMEEPPARNAAWRYGKYSFGWSSGKMNSVFRVYCSCELRWCWIKLWWIRCTEIQWYWLKIGIDHGYWMIFRWKMWNLWRCLQWTTWSRNGRKICYEYHCATLHFRSMDWCENSGIFQNWETNEKIFFVLNSYQPITEVLWNFVFVLWNIPQLKLHKNVWIETNSISKVMVHNILLVKELMQSFYGKYLDISTDWLMTSIFRLHSAQLPRGLSCSRCVLQWRYHAGNNWGRDIETGQPCLGCGAQEEFYKYESFFSSSLHGSTGRNFLVVQMLVSSRIITISSHLCRR